MNIKPSQCPRHAHKKRDMTSAECSRRDECGCSFEPKERLLSLAEKHKGTDLGGLLQSTAYLLGDYIEALDDLRAENESLRADCVTMHQGLMKIDAISDTLHSMAFGAMPVNPYATVAKDNSMHANIMNYHGVEGYGKKGRPTNHKDIKIKTVIL